MDLVPIKIEHGEERAWDAVCALGREEVCAKTGTTFDEARQAYLLRAFGVEFDVTPCDMRIGCRSERGGLFLGRLRDLFRMAVLRYLATAREIPPTGRLIRPADVKGGHRFTTGTHVLPLEALAAKYARDRAGFLAKGRAYGGEAVAGTGDAVLRLHPLPRVPVTLVLWLEDEEFPARVDLYFDSTCEFQLEPSDVVWAVALLSCVVMLDG